MITEEQFLQLVRYVTGELKTSREVILTDATLKSKFGITPPFRRAMRAFAKKHKPTFDVEITQTIDDEPVKLVFQPVT